MLYIAMFWNAMHPKLKPVQKYAIKVERVSKRFLGLEYGFYWKVTAINSLIEMKYSSPIKMEQDWQLLQEITYDQLSKLPKKKVL